MKKITKILALVLALALVFSLTACGKTTIVGNWKYNLDFMKLMEASGQISDTEGDGEDAAYMKTLVDAMKKLYEGLNMVIVLDLKEDNTFTMGTDEASMKAAGEKIKERAPEVLPEVLKAMFGEEQLNAMMESEGKTIEDYAAQFAEQFDVSDMEMDAVKGTYTYEEGKLVLTAEDGESTTMKVELSSSELKVTDIEGGEDMAESFKAILPMVFSK